LFHLPLHHLLHQYGYLALFAGCLLEGETLLILAGFAAHQGYLSIYWVILLAACAGTLGDQFFFFLGRCFGARVLRRIPQSEARVAQVNRLLMRHYRGFIIAIRFMYGLRVAGPIIIGASKVPAMCFVVFNMIGACIWAVLVAGAGYLFGKTMAHLFAHFRQFEGIAVLLIIAFCLVSFCLHHRWRRRH
jgi:membrane protein DedA with SNARE-associated domain